MKSLHKLGLISCIIVSNLASTVNAQIPAIPQIPAFLPMVDQVPASQAQPLDGVWLINTIRKKIRIQSGRAYAVDGWVHLFTLKIEPGMVVIKDILPTAAGQYSGEDLPLIGKWSARVAADRSLSVTVSTLLTPVTYKLIPVQLDNPQWYAQEMTAAGLVAPQQGYQPAQTQTYQPAPPAQYTQPPQAPVAQQPRYQAPTAPVPSTSGCAETEYDPATDTTRCYNGGGQ